LLAASALCPVGVARVSRLIGKFDSTENRPGWQVGFTDTFSVGTFQACQSCPNAPNATRDGVAFLCLAQITGLPNQLRAVVISTAPSTGSPGRFPFERAASLAVGSCLVLLFFWLIGVSPLQPVHHWHPPYSNSRTVSSSACFHGLARLVPRIFLDSGRGFKARIQETVGMA
jgi:hypothetical protein